MKALSVKQPFAELIARGRKTLEIRSWSTDYRGELLIVASKSPPVVNGWPRELHTGNLLRGCAVCLVELVGVRPMCEGEKDERAAWCDYDEGALAWVLANPRRVTPVLLRGKLRLFDVPDGALGLSWDQLARAEHLGRS